MKNDRLHYLEKAVDYVAERTSYFGVDEIRISAECMGLTPPPSNSDWSRVLRGAVSKGKIEMTDKYKRSILKESNGIPRMIYRKKKSKKSEIEKKETIISQ